MSISKKDIRMLKHALDVSDMSDFPKYHIGCVVALKGKVLNASFNSEKTHPLQKIFNKQRFSCDNTPHSLHAEIHALALLQNEDIDWKNVTVYIGRKRRKDGENGMARPCPTCMRMMKELGIKHIIYTTDFGVAEEVLD